MLLSIFSNLFAQKKIDSIFYSKAKENAVNFFNQKYESQLPINKGFIYRQSLSQTEYFGTTFFGEHPTYRGDIFYSGNLYENVELAYDLQNDNIIHIKPTGEWIVLIKSKTSYFDLGNRHFITTAADSSKAFYELLSDGKAQLLAKHVLVINKYLAGSFKKEISRTAISYVNVNGQIYPARSRNDLLKAFSDKRKDVANYIKEQDLSFGKNSDSSVLSVVKYYNGLN